MPIFEYLCKDCSKVFERLVMSSNEEIACPSCGSKDLERQFSTFSLSGSPTGPSCGPCTPSPSKCSGCR